MTHSTLVAAHPTPRMVETSNQWDLSLMPAVPFEHSMFLTAAGRSGRLLPPTVHDALIDFGDDPGQTGGLLIRGVPIGSLPLTPPNPTADVSKDSVSEFSLLTVARLLGQPIGYLPEHGGAIVQNILPVRGAAKKQISTSSKVTLMFHTEAAFHPHRPRYLVLLCLRGDRDGQARTTLASIRQIAPLLDDSIRRTLFEPRFRTSVDESYVGMRSTRLGPAVSVLSGTWERPNMVFDVDLMQGIDSAAQSALNSLAEATSSHHTGVVLDAGDLLVIDNQVAVHGRTSFTPRFDGFDRWLQRTFVVSDLSTSAADRVGRVIATQFQG